MMRITHTHMKLRVYTYKEGFLARVAHDLCLELGEFDVQVQGDTITAEFALESLSPLGAIVSGALDPTALSASDLAEIKKTLQREVLEVKRFARARFTGRYTATGDSLAISGELELHGRKRPLSFAALRQGQVVRGEALLTPSDYGIAPYRALMGALKLKDRVRVTFELDEAAVSRP
jgi:hypothetical protein